MHRRCRRRRPARTAADPRHGGVHEPGAGPGQPVDQRADIWAFGCVLYEMLDRPAGVPGGTATDTIAAVLTGEVDRNAMPANVPPPMRQLRRSMPRTHHQGSPARYRRRASVP